ncbi:MAG: substrate-binding domain-containing protein [Clostridiales bacterium]|nr:substrate-binding domain-containing protein [Clostridiales bacterium]
MKFKIIALALAFALFGAGCGTGVNNSESETAAEEENTIPTDPEERLNIAISMPEENEYSKKLAKEFTNKLWQKGYNIILRYGENDAETQREQIEELFEQDIKCLIFCPVTSADLEIDSLNTEGIPVINLDILNPNTECTDLYVTYDNVKIGEDIGDYIISTKNLDSAKGVTIEFLLGENTSATQDLYKGIMNKLSSYLKNGALECRSGRTELESCTTTAKTAVAVMNDLGRYLSGYYLNSDLEVCVTGADYIASGCGGYFITNGYTLDEFPTVTGVNGEASAVRDFEQGFLSMTSFKDASSEAETCAEAVNILISGGDIDSLTKTKTANGSKNVPIITLEGQTLTSENYNDILVNSEYYLTEEIYG